MTTLQSRAASAYATVGLESRATASGGVDLVILLIEGILERIKLARAAMEQRDIPQKIKHINKALEIFSEGLRAYLDMASGGEIAVNLDDLYAYCSVRLLHANSRNEMAALDEVSALLGPLLNAWMSVRNGNGASVLDSQQNLVEVARALKSTVPSAQRLYGSNAYASFSAMGR